MNLEIRPEIPADTKGIRGITEAAFAVAQYSDGNENAIIDALRASGALTISLVGLISKDVVGHLAFSPVTIDGADVGWFGLGPVSVRPDLHRQGIGTALVREGLRRLQLLAARGCVVLGDPHYYGRFGFESDPLIRFDGVPPEYFMRMAFDQPLPSGSVAYHRAFSP